MVINDIVIRMATDYDTWLLNIVEGNEPKAPAKRVRFVEDEQDVIRRNEREYEGWLEKLKDRGGR